jgi:cytochrome o ubiquinol oxidase subunit 2
MPNDFITWVNNVKAQPQQLDEGEYSKLAQPSSNLQPIYYSSATPSLFNSVIDKYMVPSNQTMTALSGMEMQ